MVQNNPGTALWPAGPWKQLANWWSGRGKEAPPGSADQLLPVGVAFLEGPEQIETPEVRLFAEHLCTLPKHDGVALASAFRPETLPHLAPYIGIFGVLEGRYAFKIRLLGTAFVKFLGEDSTGQVLDETGDLYSQRAVALLRAAVWTRRDLISHVSRSRRKNREHLSVETLIVPLAELGGAVSKIIIIHRSHYKGEIT